MFPQYGFIKPSPLSCSDGKSSGAWNIYNSLIGIWSDLPNIHYNARQFLLLWFTEQLEMSKNNEQVLHANGKAEIDQKVMQLSGYSRNR